MKNNSDCENIRLSKCIKHVDSKCVKIEVICANLILTLFVKICIVFPMSIKFNKTNFNQIADIHTYVKAICHMRSIVRLIMTMFAFMQSASRQQMHICFVTFFLIFVLHLSTNFVTFVDVVTIFSRLSTWQACYIKSN